MEKDHSNYGVGIIRSGQAVPGLFPLGVAVLGMAAWFMEKDYNGVKARVVVVPITFTMQNDLVGPDNGCSQTFT